MHKDVKEIRERLADIGFDFWVRRFNENLLCVGSVYGSDKRMAALVERLEGAWDCSCTGKRGTVGEHIIDVKRKEQNDLH